MATPPPRGGGMTCTSRSRGAAIMRKRIASIRTTGVVRKVTSAAVSRTTAYSRIGSADALRLGLCDRQLQSPAVSTHLGALQEVGAAVGPRYRDRLATLRV